MDEWNVVPQSLDRMTLVVVFCNLGQINLFTGQERSSSFGCLGEDRQAGLDRSKMQCSHHFTWSAIWECSD